MEITVKSHLIHFNPDTGIVNMTAPDSTQYTYNANHFPSMPPRIALAIRVGDYEFLNKLLTLIK